MKLTLANVFQAICAITPIGIAWSIARPTGAVGIVLGVFLGITFGIVSALGFTMCCYWFADRPLASVERLPAAWQVVVGLLFLSAQIAWLFGSAMLASIGITLVLRHV